MTNVVSRVARPVKRSEAEANLLITLLSFASTVTLVRLYLKFAGYPEIGRGSFHIAHLLWGGLLLFIAALLPVIFANRWTYKWGAFLSGVGVGLFIDEVGKFITRSNNYFYPGAAPIIYAFFLLLVLLYIRIKRPYRQEPRTELYHALDTLEEALDHTLTEEDYDELVESLEKIRDQTRHEDYARLASELLSFLRSRSFEVAPERPTLPEKILETAVKLEKLFLKRALLKWLIVASLLWFGLDSLDDLFIFLRAATQPVYLENMIRALAAHGQVISERALPAFVVRFFFQGMSSVALLSGATALVARREKAGITAGYFGLLLSLTITNLFLFYFDQFRAIAGALIQFILFLALIRYRKRFIYPLSKKS